MFKEVSYKELNVPAIPVFIRQEWGKALANAFPYLSFSYYVYNDSFLVRVTRIDGRTTTAPFSISGDVVSLKGEKLDVAAFERNVRNVFGQDAVLYVHTYYCSVSGEYTAALHDYVVSLTAPQELKHTFRKTTRHIIEQPIIAGSITSATKPKDIVAAYRLYCASMRKAKAPAFTRAFFNALIAQEGTTLLVWKPKQTVTAMAVFLTDGERIYYYLSAASPTGIAQHAPHHLLWHAMVTYQDAEKKELFLGGVRSGDALEVFKRGWRGKRYDVFSFGDESKRDTRRQSLLRTLWGMLPSALLPWLTRIVGRKVF